MRTAYDILRAQPFLAGLTDWQLSGGPDVRNAS